MCDKEEDKLTFKIKSIVITIDSYIEEKILPTKEDLIMNYIEKHRDEILIIVNEMVSDVETKGRSEKTIEDKLKRNAIIHYLNEKYYFTRKGYFAHGNGNRVIFAIEN